MARFSRGSKIQANRLERDSIRVERMNKICVYAIAKNENNNVRGWYDSMKEADHVVVLDTGSTDDTVSILKELGIYGGTKTYDEFRFDVARNDALALVPEDCNIRVVMDLDERLEPGWAQPLRDRWDPDKHVRGTYKKILLPYGIDSVDDITPFSYTFNWIHGPQWGWKFPCHEAMVRNGITRYSYSEALDCTDFMISVHHPDSDNVTRPAYLNLLKIRVEENPTDPTSLVYLLREFSYYADWKSIIDLEDSIRSDYMIASYADYQAGLIFLGLAYENMENESRALGCYYEAIFVDESLRASYVYLGKLLVKMKHFDAATDIYEKALRTSVKWEHWVWIDVAEWWTYGLYDLLSVSTYWHGEYEKSLRYASLARKYLPDDERIKANYNYALDKVLEAMP